MALYLYSVHGSAPGRFVVASGPWCKRATGVGSFGSYQLTKEDPRPVAVRVSPSEAILAQIHELFASDGELLSVLEQVARLSVRLTFQSVIEEIVCEELGRDRYQPPTADRRPLVRVHLHTRVSHFRGRGRCSGRLRRAGQQWRPGPA